VKKIRAFGLALLLFLAVYIPAFAVAGGLHLPIDAAIPVIVLVTFLIAILLARLIGHRLGIRMAEFGFRWPIGKYILYAVGLAVPISAALAIFLSQAHEPGPLAGVTLSPGLVYLYFVLGAPIQEETIFRGLLQTMLARWLALASMSNSAAGVSASIFAAILFALIHLAVGPYTAAAALLLGALAGELRRRSESLIPAIICHAIFNLGGILWS
jgi:membrane protease YdiL (CAAX protease family)